VVQIPLIMHLPSSIARTAGVNAEVIGFSTDITPTLYVALGYLHAAGHAADVAVAHRPGANFRRGGARRRL
jgi:hypothetical protein